MKYLLVFLFWGSLSQAGASPSCKPELMAEDLSPSQIVEICRQESLTTDHEFLAWWIPEQDKNCRAYIGADTNLSYQSCMTSKIQFVHDVLTCSQSPQRLQEMAQLDLKFEEEFMKKYGEVNVPDAIAYIFSKLIHAAERHYKFEIKKPAWNLRAYGASFSNASAAADGRIFISSGMWEEAGLSIGEIAAILAHEISHVIYNHSLKIGCLKYEWIGEAQDTTLQGAWTEFHNDLNIYMGRGKSWSEHSQKYEYEADQNGMKLLKLIGLDTGLMARALIKISPKEESAMPSGSHPSTYDRVAALNR